MLKKDFFEEYKVKTKHDIRCTMCGNHWNDYVIMTFHPSTSVEEILNETDLEIGVICKRCFLTDPNPEYSK